jgi:spore coat protein A
MYRPLSPRFGPRALLFALALLLPTLLPSRADAGSAVLEPSKDNTLYEDPAGADSNGVGPLLFAGQTGTNGGERVLRAVLEFDVAGNVPAGATITSASLTLNLAGAPPIFIPATTTLHRALAEWGEGTSSSTTGDGDVSTTGDATWIHTFYDTTFWTTAGGDYVATASASQSVLVLGPYTWASAQLIADVQLFLDTPSSNHGWVLIGNETPGHARRYDSRESTTPSLRPTLTIIYDEASAPNGACCIADASATCNEVTEADCTTAGGTYQGDLSTCAPAACPVIPTPFSDAMPIPAVATPVSGSAGSFATYDIAIREVQQVLHSELPASTVWAYGDGPSGAVFPGPTIEATSNQLVSVNWINDLRDTAIGGNPPPLRSDHLLDVDLCPHGAQNLPKTVVHLHGTHTDEMSDGYPESTFLPGEQDQYTYPNDQLPGTLWYHDHSLGITRLNVYLGLAGFYLLRDATEAALGLPSGEFEIPLAIQDRSFNPDGSLRYPSALEQTFFGDTILVNGRVWPFHQVKRGKYRLRILNGSNSRHLTLQFCPGDDTSPCPSPASFDLIGNDLGLLPAPVSLTSITLGPAERADVIFDFEPAVLPGDTEVFLVNSAPAPFPGPPGAGVVPDVLRFDVQDVAGDIDPVPPVLRPFVPLDENDAVVHRDFELSKSGATQCSDFRWEIVSMVDGNPVGSTWNDITEYPELDTIEVWRFINRSGMTHPMHLHQKDFQVLDRQNFTVVDDEIVPTGSPSPPAAEEAGPKDTIQVHPLEMVRIIKRFEDYTGLFAYHCHILEHEDQEMMRQFQTIQCGNAELEPTEECDDGNTVDGDGCSARCDLEDTLSLHGVAEGGDVTVTVDGILLVVATSPGETDSQVVAAIAAAIEADPTLSAAGVTAFAAGPTVITTGTFDSVVVNDPGLAVPAPIPTVAPWGVFAIGSALAGVALWRRRRGFAA